MIDFTCPTCNKAFSVPETFAGRSATCKKCGATITVPATVAASASTSPPTAPKIPMRTRRLQSDAKQVSETFRASPLITVHAQGEDTPDVYHVDYTIKSLERGPKGEPAPREQHKVEIRLTSDYPRLSPQCKMLTPIFHPNIDPDGTTICIGDHWTAGERLADLIIRIGEMIAYQAYNIRSPLDGEAAMWADLNQNKLPLDGRSLHPSVE